MYKMLGMIADVLLIVGGLNWGLVAFFNMNLVSMLFGGTVLATAVYGLVALAAVYRILGYFGMTKCSC
jgi:uncharacterized membrane protein YuzA (DUF378 family)